MGFKYLFSFLIFSFDLLFFPFQLKGSTKRVCSSKTAPLLLLPTVLSSSLSGKKKIQYKKKKITIIAVVPASHQSLYLFLSISPSPLFERPLHLFPAPFPSPWEAPFYFLPREARSLSRSLQRYCSCCVFTLVWPKKKNRKNTGVLFFLGQKIQEFAGGFSEENLPGEGGFGWFWIFSTNLCCEVFDQFFFLNGTSMFFFFF